MANREELKTKLQGAIDRFVPLFEGYGDETYRGIYKEVLIALGRFNPSYFIDLDRDGFRATHPETLSPVIFSYERITPEICALWDSDHPLSATILRMEQEAGMKFQRAYRIPKPFRPYIFRDALKKAYQEGPIKNLALELTCDTDQNILDECAAGRISYAEAGQHMIDFGHISTSLDNYEALLHYALTRGIKIHAIDVAIDSPLHQDSEENIRRRDENFKTNLKEISKTGKTFLVVGSGHRRGLLNTLRAP